MSVHRRLSPLLLSSVLLACTGDLGGSEGPPPPAYLAADGVTVTRVAIYQGIERDLMKDGAEIADGVPLVRGRDAMVRVFYTTDAKYDGNVVLARLTITDTPNAGAGAGGGGGGDSLGTAVDTPIEVTGTLFASSNGDDLASTVNFDVPGKLLTPSSSFRVEFLRARAQSTGTNTKASYPDASKRQPLHAVEAGPKVRIVLVPIVYKSDGSGRLPDTSDAQLKLYRDVFWKQYPTPEVDIRVGDPFEWKGIAVLGSGQGWGELLNAFVAHRQASNAAFDEYYYGLFQAADTFANFCGGGCIAGLSQVALNPSDAFARAGIGIGYSGEGVAETAIHEVGHEHGRGHVPCGTNQGVDPGYPHSNGEIGSLGYDLITKQLVKADHKDFMSYCDPKWISDFTFSALLKRVQAVNMTGMAWQLPPGAKLKKRYERVAVLPNGTFEWLSPIELDFPPSGDAEAVHVEGPSGSADVTGHFYGYSHLPGGVVYVDVPVRAKQLTVRGHVLQH